MKKNVLIILLFLLFFIACNNNGQKTDNKAIYYHGIMMRENISINIELTIDKIINPSAVKGSYLNKKDNQIIKLAGVIKDGILMLSSHNAETSGSFIFQKYNVENEEITGTWINSNDNENIYNIRLRKYNPLAAIESQEDINLIPVSIDKLRIYVGFINQGYHPEMIEFLESWKIIMGFFLILNNDNIEIDNIEKIIDNYLKGGFGTGFIYVDNDGKNYIITNYHVINQSQSPSITFENQDGTKTKFTDLKILMIDEDLDLALLAFPDGQNPFTNGMKIENDSLSDGDEIYAVGYPGFGRQPLWQFGKGIVSNALVYLPKNDDWEDLKGPYIQHTAEVDPGNSGGPLLVNIAQSRNYAVTGVNTLKATGRQAANYAIPANQLSNFIKQALLQTNDNEQKIFKTKLNLFVSALKKPDANFEHISNYISDKMVSLFLKNINTGQDEDLFNNNIVISKQEEKLFENIIMKLISDPIDGIKKLAAYSFHNNIGLNLKDNDVSVKEIKLNENNSFYVSFFINGDTIAAQWIKEYGVWRIDNFSVIERHNNSIKKAEEINIGNSITVNSNANSKWYKLDMASDGWLNIFTEGNNDTELSIYDGNGALIAKDDDSGYGYNASIVIGALKGTIFIEASENSPQRNNFSLVTKIVNGNFKNVSKDQAVYISPDITLTSAFQNDSYIKWYKVEIPSTANSLTVYSEGRMDTKISLYDSAGRLIKEDDDSGDEYNAMVSSSAKGTIYIKIEELERRAGEYKLINQVK
jgi:S1-C subfamily serine protease